MKKLMIAAALIACAVSANAAKVTWGASSALDSTKIAASSTMYLVYTDATGTALDIDKLKDSTTKKFTADNLSAAGVTKTLDSFTVSSSKFNNQTAGGSDGPLSPASTGLTAGNQPMYYICISSDGEYIAQSGKMSIPINISTNTAAKKTSSWTYVAAPEPTSGLLLLLGVAGLALRRKQK